MTIDECRMSIKEFYLLLNLINVERQAARVCAERAISTINQYSILNRHSFGLRIAGNQHIA